MTPLPPALGLHAMNPTVLHIPNRVAALHLNGSFADLEGHTFSTTGATFATTLTPPLADSTFAAYLDSGDFSAVSSDFASTDLWVGLWVYAKHSGGDPFPIGITTVEFMSMGDFTFKCGRGGAGFTNLGFAVYHQGSLLSQTATPTWPLNDWVYFTWRLRPDPAAPTTASEDNLMELGWASSSGLKTSSSDLYVYPYLMAVDDFQLYTTSDSAAYYPSDAGPFPDTI